MRVEAHTRVERSAFWHFVLFRYYWNGTGPKDLPAGSIYIKREFRSARLMWKSSVVMSYFPNAAPKLKVRLHRLHIEWY